MAAWQPARWLSARTKTLLSATPSYQPRAACTTPRSAQGPRYHSEPMLRRAPRRAVAPNGSHALHRCPRTIRDPRATNQGLFLELDTQTRRYHGPGGQTYRQSCPYRPDPSMSPPPPPRPGNARVPYRPVLAMSPPPPPRPGVSPVPFAQTGRCRRPDPELAGTNRGLIPEVGAHIWPIEIFMSFSHTKCLVDDPSISQAR